MIHEFGPTGKHGPAATGSYQKDGLATGDEIDQGLQDLILEHQLFGREDSACFHAGIGPWRREVATGTDNMRTLMGIVQRPVAAVPQVHLQGVG